MTSKDVQKAIEALQAERDRQIEMVAAGASHSYGSFGRLEDDIAALSRLRDRLSSGEARGAGVRG